MRMRRDRMCGNFFLKLLRVDVLIGRLKKECCPLNTSQWSFLAQTVVFFQYPSLSVLRKRIRSAKVLPGIFRCHHVRRNVWPVFCKDRKSKNLLFAKIAKKEKNPWWSFPGGNATIYGGNPGDKIFRTILEMHNTHKR